MMSWAGWMTPPVVRVLISFDRPLDRRAQLGPADLGVRLLHRFS